MVAPGAKPFLFFGVLATCEPGDEVIYPNPGFPIYESVIRFAGATPVPMPLVEERGFAFSAEDLAERLTPRTRLVILNSPANPTGGIVDAKLTAEIAAVLADHDCWILSDEVYSEMLYGERHDTVAAHDGLLDRTLLVDGFSKTFAMTGWRLGYAALPASPRRADHAAPDQLGVLHRAGRAAGRGGGADRPARPRSTRCWPSSTAAAGPSWRG